MVGYIPSEICYTAKKYGDLTHIEMAMTHGHALRGLETLLAEHHGINVDNEEDYEYYCEIYGNWMPSIRYLRRCLSEITGE